LAQHVSQQIFEFPWLAQGCNGIVLHGVSYQFHFEMTDLIQVYKQSDWTRLTSSAKEFQARQQASTIAS
jgi:hypothetical protein